VKRAGRRERDWWPRPPEIDAAPELAVLAATRAVAEIAIAALLAANPELTAGDDTPLPVCALAARRVIDDACKIRRTIDGYRDIVAALAVADDDPNDDDIPF
jgi:hypothetical protein